MGRGIFHVVFICCSVGRGREKREEVRGKGRRGKKEKEMGGKVKK